MSKTQTTNPGDTMSNLTREQSLDAYMNRQHERKSLDEMIDAQEAAGVAQEIADYDMLCDIQMVLDSVNDEQQTELGSRLRVSVARGVATIYSFNGTANLKVSAETLMRWFETTDDVTAILVLV